MFDSQYEFRAAIEHYTLKLNESRAGGPLPMALSLAMPEDVTSLATGDMLAKDADCLIVQVEIDNELPNLSQHSYKDVYGGLSCYFLTKGTQPSTRYWKIAEEVARWFTHRSFNGANFHGVNLGAEVRHRGFRMFPFDVPFKLQIDLRRG